MVSVVLIYWIFQSTAIYWKGMSQLKCHNIWNFFIIRIKIMGRIQNTKEKTIFDKFSVFLIRTEKTLAIAICWKPILRAVINYFNRLTWDWIFQYKFNVVGWFISQTVERLQFSIFHTVMIALWNYTKSWEVLLENSVKIWKFCFWRYAGVLYF
jgi:hypothetical protein